MNMKLYEIDEAIYDCLNDDGEFNEEKFNELQGLRQQKLEGVALGFKSMSAYAKALAEEEKAISARRKAAEKKAEGLKTFLAISLHGEDMETSKVAVSWRKSEKLEIYDQSQVPDEYWKQGKPTIDVAGLTKAIKDGKTFPGMALVSRNNIQIK